MVQAWFTEHPLREGPGRSGASPTALPELAPMPCISEIPHHERERHLEMDLEGGTSLQASACAG